MQQKTVLLTIPVAIYNQLLSLCKLSSPCDKLSPTLVFRTPIQKTKATKTTTNVYSTTYTQQGPVHLLLGRVYAKGSFSFLLISFFAPLIKKKPATEFLLPVSPLAP